MQRVATLRNCEKGDDRNDDSVSKRSHDPDARMFDATLEVIRLFSATIAVYAQQWRTRGFLIGPPCNWPTEPSPSSSTRSSTIRDAHETRPMTRNRDRDVEISREGRRVFGQVHKEEKVVVAPVDRSALGWNQACLSSYINYALNTRMYVYVEVSLDIGCAYGEREAIL